MATVAALVLTVVAVAVLLRLAAKYASNLAWLKGVSTPGVPWPFVGHTHFFFGLKPAEILPKVLL